MPTLYLLDTNTVSHIIKRHPQAIQHLLAVPMRSVFISAITAGELAFGLAKRPEAAALKATVTEFLRRVEVLPWDDAVAQTYGTLRAQLQGDGTPLGSLDMQIAAHALHAKAILVSSDKAFQKIAALSIQDWTLQVSAS
jgi:tRNA(fMet)-specific endonuclease VapC